MTKEEQESVMERGYPDISEMIDNPDLKAKTLKKLSKDSKSLGGQKRSAHGQRKAEIEKQLRANTNYRRLIKFCQTLKKVLASSTITTQEIFLTDSIFLAVQS